MVTVEELRTEPRAAQSVASESPQLLGEESLSELFPCPPVSLNPNKKKKYNKNSRMDCPTAGPTSLCQL